MLVVRPSVRVEYNPPDTPVESFDDYMFSCHYQPQLILKQKDIVSDSLLRKIYEEAVQGKKIIIQTPEVEQGIYREEESIELVNEVLGTDFQKNEEKFSQPNIHGTPDILEFVKEKLVSIIDIKTCGSPASFDKKNKEQAIQDYHWQMVAYSYITGCRKVRIAYTDLEGKRIKIYSWHITDWDIEHFQECLQESIKRLNIHHSNMQIPF